MDRPLDTAQDRFSGSAGLLVALGVALLSVLAVLPAARLPDGATGAVAAVFLPPAETRATYETIVHAGGTPVRTTLGGMVWIARSSAPGFAGRLRAAGAVAVLDPIVATGCLRPGGTAAPRSQNDQSPGARPSG